MPYRTVLLVIFLLLPSLAIARIGETEAKNQSRYGRPVKDFRNTNSPILKGAENKTYHYQGWQIRVAYLDRVAVRMMYGKLPKPGTTQQLKMDEIEAVLQAEAHGGQWKKLKPASLFSPKNSGNKTFDHAQLRWMNTNKMMAYCPLGNFSLYVESLNATQWEKARTAKKEQQRKNAIPRF